MPEAKSEVDDASTTAPERTLGVEKPHAQPPIETDSIRITQPAGIAAGLQSVLKAAEVTLKEPGLIRGIAALSRLNQFDGIDCPGCAWPDPEHDRSLNEYCENGVKAIAEEATAKRCTPEFFRSYSVSELGGVGKMDGPPRTANASHGLQPRQRQLRTDSWEKAFAMIADELNA